MRISGGCGWLRSALGPARRAELLSEHLTRYYEVYVQYLHPAGDTCRCDNSSHREGTNCSKQTARESYSTPVASGVSERFSDVMIHALEEILELRQPRPRAHAACAASGGHATILFLRLFSFERLRVGNFPTTSQRSRFSAEMCLSVLYGLMTDACTTLAFVCSNGA